MNEQEVAVCKLSEIHDGEMKAEALYRFAQIAEPSFRQIGAAIANQRVPNDG